MGVSSRSLPHSGHREGTAIQQIRRPFWQCSKHRTGVFSIFVTGTWTWLALKRGHLQMSFQSVLLIIQVFCINILRPKQNGRHFADDNFKYIFLCETRRIFIWMWLKLFHGSDWQYVSIGLDNSFERMHVTNLYLNHWNFTLNFYLNHWNFTLNSSKLHMHLVWTSYILHLKLF